MSAVYLRLPTDSDLCIEALRLAHQLLCWGLGDCTVHVSPAWYAKDREWLDRLEREWPGGKHGGRLSVVADPDLSREREWFVDVAGMRVGSAPG